MLFTASMCDNEPYEGELNIDEPNVSCEAAIERTDEAALSFDKASETNYTDLCIVYRNVLFNQINICGDDGDALQSLIDNLGDCISVNLPDDCESITLIVEAARIAFENINGGDCTNLCSDYKKALMMQIQFCGDDSGEIQAIIDSLSDCTNVVSPIYEIGDIGPGGGFVFYLDCYGHGLEIAPFETQFFSQWGCVGKNLGTSSDLGTGQSNTNIILDFHDSIKFYDDPNQCSILDSQGQDLISNGEVAAKIADELIFNGKSDWYLPSFDELKLVGTNLVIKDLGDITIIGLASSTDVESDPSRMSVHLFGNNEPGHWTKNFNLPWRAIRSF